MKQRQTIAELGIGGEGWIIYDDFILPKRVVHVYIVDNWDKDCKYLMPQYLLREYIESNGVNMTKDLVAFGNEIVYSTKEEAESELQEQVSNTITSFELERVDWKKLADELGRIQKQFNEITEDQKKDACTFIKKLRNIVDPKPDDINWNQVRIDAAISVLNALIETSQHSDLEVLLVYDDKFTKAAVGYADKLVYELKRSEAYFEENLKKI